MSAGRRTGARNLPSVLFLPCACVDNKSIGQRTGGNQRNFKYFWLVLGSGEAGKWTAWTMADEGHRTAMVERKWLGGSCPNIACLPSKNLIYSARVASLARRGAEFGLEMDRL